MEESSNSENERHPDNNAYQNDLFLQLQEVISSLETCVLSWRNPSGKQSREESVTSPLDLSGDEKPEIMHEFNQISRGDAQVLQSEIAHFQENNAALRVKLRLTDKELDRSRATLRIFKEEREKLQTKVKNLQDILQDKGISPTTVSPPGSPVLEELSSFTSEHIHILSELKPHQTSLSPIQVLQYLQNFSRCENPVSCAPDIHPSNMESEMKWLRSERCLKTYSVLLALAEAKQEIILGQISSGDALNSGWKLLPKDLEIKTKLFLMEVKKIFQREGKISISETKKIGCQTSNR
ncbi:hypothetical protein GDO81_001307 [Engystomops pustulosus]|uniref:Uncharacterized protein n=1 Tax=Engystomops pustulosus TaxID=76066 RepID=A0AAV7DBC6_ENGPU|nr:hypothetical protein GDO81_001307 [Engystomops pustulosus]